MGYSIYNSKGLHNLAVLPNIEVCLLLVSSRANKQSMSPALPLWIFTDHIEQPEIPTFKYSVQET
jgi:hypothetical protein